MKDQATLLAVAGVIVITIGVLVTTVVTKQELDSELIKQVVTGLVGFASGAAVATVAKQ